MNNIDDVCRTDTKVCTKCGVGQPKQNYYVKSGKCKSCVNEERRVAYQKDPTKIIQRVQKYRKENPEKIRDAKLKQAYGVGTDYYNNKLAEQNGVCAGCRKNRRLVWRGKEVEMALDHCHTTGKPRGVLCDKCNRAFGLLDENITTMENLIEYKRKYQKLR